MVRYFLRFSYIGTQYRGVQKQVSSPYVRDTDTIQDAGVHALCNTGHVELQNKYNVLYKTDEINRFVNNYFNKCGHTIRLLECTPVTNDFHARFSCKSRTYIYRFMIPKVPDEQRLSLVDTQHTYFIRESNFDIDRVKHGTELFMGIKDFTTFTPPPKTNKEMVYVRSLHIFALEEAQTLIPFDPLSENFRYFHFVCKAKSFLYNQIRRMVGALIALGRRKITEKDITVMLQVPSHNNWDPRITPALASGLHLVNLEYDQEELSRCTILDDQKVQSEGLPSEEQELQLEEQKQELAK
ncbi:PREDICTED: tRNA pseudouridine synthase-like 1 isoform X2 [Dinoponera quadriceps]|uniref:tRNA pseudouridine synthase n=1 Tax=Dinoponera quadriceps TaxID=609295 RepID=A0A6P3X9Y0_DINQU|nr:PREDICTED: tRNA pseudouridine synthase-like 1 isoform X2 [Dinoponera quadriceps]